MLLTEILQKVQLVPKIIIAKVAIVNYSGIKSVGVLHDNLVMLVTDHWCSLLRKLIFHVVKIIHDFAKLLLCFLVQIWNGNSSGENSIIGVICGERCGCFSGQIVEFLSRDASIQAINDFKSDGDLRNLSRWSKKIWAEEEENLLDQRTPYLSHSTISEYGKWFYRSGSLPSVHLSTINALNTLQLSNYDSIFLTSFYDKHLDHFRSLFGVIQ